MVKFNSNYFTFMLQKTPKNSKEKDYNYILYHPSIDNIYSVVKIKVKNKGVTPMYD